MRPRAGPTSWARPEASRRRRRCRRTRRWLLQLYRAAFADAGPQRDGYRVQLGAFRSLENADRLWQTVWRAQWDLLAGSSPHIESLERAAGEPLYLLQIGALDGLDTAQSLCRRLSARGIDCLVVRPAGLSTMARAT